MIHSIVLLCKETSVRSKRPTEVNCRRLGFLANTVDWPSEMLMLYVSNEERDTTRLSRENPSEWEEMTTEITPY